MSRLPGYTSPTMEEQTMLSIREAAHRVGRAEITIRRLAKNCIKLPGFENRVQLVPRVGGGGPVYLLDIDFLYSQFGYPPPEATTQKTQETTQNEYAGVGEGISQKSYAECFPEEGLEHTLTNDEEPLHWIKHPERVVKEATQPENVDTPAPTQATHPSPERELIDTLKGTIVFLQEEIKSKNTQIATLNETTNHVIAREREQNMLHAMQDKKIEEKIDV